MKNPFIIGKQIYLRPHQKDDIEKWCQWRNDSSVTKLMYAGTFPNTIELQEELFNKIIRNERQDHLQLAIVEIETDSLLGTHSLSAIDNIHRNAEYGMIIGENVRGRGIGREAAALIHWHAFSNLNLHRIWAGQHQNLSAWRDALIKFIGYKEEGILREAMWKHNRWWNVHMIGCLHNDFWQKWEKYWKEYFKGIIHEEIF